MFEFRIAFVHNIMCVRRTFTGRLCDLLSGYVIVINRSKFLFQMPIFIIIIVFSLILTQIGFSWYLHYLCAFENLVIKTVKIVLKYKNLQKYKQ